MSSSPAEEPKHQATADLNLLPVLNLKINVKLFLTGTDAEKNVGELFVYHRYISCQLTFRYYFLLRDWKV